MEALTAVSVAALRFYDMCKALDKAMTIQRRAARTQDRPENQATSNAKEISREQAKRYDVHDRDKWHRL